MSLRVSIVVPSFNQAEYLPCMLDSIFGQSHPPHEVVVMDGASTDGSIEVLQQYAKCHPNLTWQSEPDDGPADAVNKGFERVHGDIIGIMSADDVYYQNAFSTVVNAFAANPDCGMVYGDVDGIDENGRQLYTRKLPAFTWESFFGISCCLPQGSIFFRRSVMSQVGGWNARYYSCDLDYWLRIALTSKVFHVAKVLSGWRRYEGQRTSEAQAQKIRDGYFSMLDDNLELVNASWGMRRLVLASRYLLAMRCPPAGGRLIFWGHLMLGACMHPGFWRYSHPVLYMRMLPGFVMLQCLRSRAKRSVGGRR